VNKGEKRKGRSLTLSDPSVMTLALRLASAT
jgi:hypothetical protein